MFALSIARRSGSRCSRFGAIRPRRGRATIRAFTDKEQGMAKILVAQGGGPTAVINQSLVGVVLEARRFRGVDTRLRRAPRRARHRQRRLHRPDARRPAHNLELVAATPSSALGSTRDKPDLAYCQRDLRGAAARTTSRYFFYIGGNDSSDTVRIVSEEARKAGYPLRCIHIPKTIDNDLVRQRPHAGLPVGGAVRGAGVRRRQPRQRGAARRLRRRGHGPPRGLPDGGLGARRSKFPDDGPHLIYVPERAFDARALPGRREGRATSATAAA